MGVGQTVPSAKGVSRRDWVSLVPQAQDREAGTAGFDFVSALRAESISQGSTVSLVQVRIGSYSILLYLMLMANME